MKLTFQKLLIAVSTAVLILFVGHLLMGKETLMNHINPVLALFLLFLAAFVVLLLQQWLHNRRPTYTATATIVSRRTEPGRYMRNKSAGPFAGTSTINYIVTFLNRCNIFISCSPERKNISYWRRASPAYWNGKAPTSDTLNPMISTKKALLE